MVETKKKNRTTHMHTCTHTRRTSGMRSMRGLAGDRGTIPGSVSAVWVRKRVANASSAPPARVKPRGSHGAQRPKKSAKLAQSIDTERRDCLRSRTQAVHFKAHARAHTIGGKGR